ncbi:DMT family transporter [Streptosporangium sp. NPDC051022]|uniref:DMT family transporter n=1 Tax=Streptosporangium sp. NPDC051022 TaxID=3155752 RepID=UPI0034424672
MAVPGRSPLAGTTAAVATGITANLIWGLAFLVPVLLSAFDPVVITLGRYVSYGIVSLLILAVTRTRLRGLGRDVWLMAALFAFTGNVGYYFFLVQGVALVGAPVVAVIIGTLPVTVALYGNWRQREFPFGRLALPVALIATGLVIVNLTEAGWSGTGDRPLAAQLAGSGCALLALLMWTWYGVANAAFLKTHPDMSSGRWSTLIGVVTLVMALLASPLLLLGSSASPAPGAGGAGDSVAWLIAGSLVLGVLVSWGGTLLWNRASHQLPVSVSGQLIVFETISGLSYVFLAERRLPPPVEVVGIAVVIVGVLIGIRRSMRQAAREPVGHLNHGSDR